MNENFEVFGDPTTNTDPVSEKEFLRDLPVPLYWRVIISPSRPKEETRGGIYIPKANQETQEILNCVGKILALGHYAGADIRLGGDGKDPGPLFPKVGDTIFYGQHAGQRMLYRGCKIIILNDDEILAIVPNPDTVTTSA